jgi:LuxR family maltose regulon positive regulatory protein
LDAPGAEKAWGELELTLSMLPALAAAHPDARALALTSLAGTQLWTGDFAAAEASVHVALAAAAAEGCEYPRMLALGKLALLAFRHGQLHDVATYGGRSLVLAEEAGLPARHRTGLGHLALAMAALEWNDRVAFDRHLDDAAGTTDAATDPVVRVAVSMMVAFRFGLDGHRAEALELLADLPTAVAGAALPAWLSARIAITEAAVELRCGAAPEQALRVLDRATVRSAEWQLGAAAASWAAGDPVTARRLIDPILTGPDPVIESAPIDAGVLSCRLHLDAGDRPAARRDLLQALAVARPHGRRRPFVEARSWLGPFIRETPDLVVAAAWLGTAMSAGPTSGSADHSDVAPALVEPLTDRERTVLARMALAMSVADIAVDLHVSANTVKTHQKSLYRKLSVQRANDAVRRGRQLQLI